MEEKKVRIAERNYSSPDEGKAQMYHGPLQQLLRKLSWLIESKFENGNGLIENETKNLRKNLEHNYYSLKSSITSMII